MSRIFGAKKVLSKCVNRFSTNQAEHTHATEVSSHTKKIVCYVKLQRRQKTDPPAVPALVTVSQPEHHSSLSVQMQFCVVKERKGRSENDISLIQIEWFSADTGLWRANHRVMSRGCLLTCLQKTNPYHAGQSTPLWRCQSFQFGPFFRGVTIYSCLWIPFLSFIPT